MKATVAGSPLVVLLIAALTGPVTAAAASARVPARATRLAAAAVPRQGPLLAWGLNESGQLGTSDTTSYLNDHGQGADVGRGDLGQLGNGHRVKHNAPLFVRLPRGVRVTAVSAFVDGARTVDWKP